MKNSENVESHGKKRVKKRFSTSLETNLNADKVHQEEKSRKID